MSKKRENLQPLRHVNLLNEEEKRSYNRNLFNIVAPKYKNISRLLSFGQDRRWKKKLIAELPNKSKVACLDLACGTADICKALSEKYFDSSIVGLDLNESMISHAELTRSNDNIRFVVGDMCAIAENDEHFDIITGGYALRNAPNLDKALSEIKRVMKKGGSAVFLDFSKPENRIIQAIQINLLKFWGSLWGMLFHGKPEVYGYIAESLRRYPDRVEMKKRLRNIGFTNITSRLHLFGFIEVISFEK